MALENKLGITESSELARAREKISKKRALEMFESGLLDTFEAGTFNDLPKEVSLFRRVKGKAQR